MLIFQMTPERIQQEIKNTKKIIDENWRKMPMSTLREYESYLMRLKQELVERNL